MLIFTRNKMEVFMVGKNTKITILNVEGQKVKIGISAPKEIEVHREEIFNKINIKNKKIRNDATLADSLVETGV